MPVLLQDVEHPVAGPLVLLLRLALDCTESAGFNHVLSNFLELFGLSIEDPDLCLTIT